MGGASTICTLLMSQVSRLSAENRRNKTLTELENIPYLIAMWFCGTYKEGLSQGYPQHFDYF